MYSRYEFSHETQQPVAQKAYAENWSRRQMLEACKKQTTKGGSYIALGDYYQLQTEVEKLRYLSQLP